MLSNITFLETRIQRLLAGVFFVGKGLGVNVQRMLKMSRGLYTGGNFKRNTCKSEGKLGTLFAIMIYKLTIWCQLMFYQFIYIAIAAYTTTTFTAS